MTQWAHRCGATFSANAGEVVACPGCGQLCFANAAAGNDPIAEAEARGYRRAVAALRDDNAYGQWRNAQVEPRTLLRAVERDVAADYLEWIAPLALKPTTPTETAAHPGGGTTPREGERP